MTSGAQAMSQSEQAISVNIHRQSRGLYDFSRSKRLWPRSCDYWVVGLSPGAFGIWQTLVQAALPGPATGTSSHAPFAAELLFQRLPQQTDDIGQYG